MNRRDILIGASALTALPLVGHATATHIAYMPGLVAERLAQGETVFVDYYAEWCSTCRRQDRIIQTLRSANPAYDAAMTFVRVDWDRFEGSDIVERYAIPRRSTLLVLRGQDELGRIVAGTREDDIRDLLDLGLN